MDQYQIKVSKREEISRVIVSKSWKNSFEKCIECLTPAASKLFVLVDVNVLNLYNSKITKLANKTNLECKIFTVEEGEGAKSIESLSRLYQECERFGLDRDSIIVSIGGGVVGDLGGLVASTYMRGIRWVNIPTTLLSIVDSSMGGKTGINTSLSKNAIGSFWFPEFVIIDSSFIKTLSKRKISSGFAEIIKYGLLSDEIILDELEELEPDVGQLINLSIVIKKGFIEKDPFDKKERMFLNLGHTLGHAVERFHDYQNISHGEAVSLGILFSLFVSFKRLNFPFEDFLRVYRLLLRFHLFKKDMIPNPEALVPIIARDKKQMGGSINEIFIKSIGEPQILSVSIEEWIDDYSAFFIAVSRLAGNFTLSPTTTLCLSNQP